MTNSAQAGLRIDTSTPTVTGDIFQNNGGAAIAMDATSAPSVTINSPSDVSGNGTNGVSIDNGTITANTTWNSPSIVYVVTSTVTVASGATLTIDAGQVVKATPGYHGLDIQGALNASGTAAAPIYFTSLRDDSAETLGDTANDGGTPIAKQGDWNGLYFDTGSSGNLDHIVVRYGGSDLQGEVQIKSASLSLTNSTLIDCSSAGLRIDGSSPTVIGDTFQDNAGPAIAMDATSDPSISVAAGTVTNNSINGVSIDNGTITANTTWNSPSIVFDVNGGITVASGATLTIDAGQVVKFASGNGMTVNGTLHALGATNQSVVFTSLRDDTAVNDTNNDGNTTTPAPGDWLGLIFASGSTGNLLDHVEVR